MLYWFFAKLFEAMRNTITTGSKLLSGKHYSFSLYQTVRQKQFLDWYNISLKLKIIFLPLDQERLSTGSRGSGNEQLTRLRHLGNDCLSWLCVVKHPLNRELANILAIKRQEISLFLSDKISKWVICLNSNFCRQFKAGKEFGDKLTEKVKI